MLPPSILLPLSTLIGSPSQPILPSVSLPSLNSDAALPLITVQPLNPSLLLQYYGNVATAGPCAPCYYSIKPPRVHYSSFFISIITIEINEVTRTVLNGSGTVETVTKVNNITLGSGLAVTDVLAKNQGARTYTRPEDITWIEDGRTFTWPTVYYEYTDLVLASGQTPRLGGPVDTGLAKWPNTISNPFVVPSTTCSAPTTSQAVMIPTFAAVGALWYNQTVGSIDSGLALGYPLPTGILEAIGSIPFVQNQLTGVPFTACLSYTPRTPAQTCAAIWEYCTVYSTFGVTASTSCFDAATTCSGFWMSTEAMRSGSQGPTVGFQAPATLLLTKQPELRTGPVQGPGDAVVSTPAFAAPVITPSIESRVRGVSSVATGNPSDGPMVPTSPEPFKGPASKIDSQQFTLPTTLPEGPAQTPSPALPGETHSNGAIPLDDPPKVLPPSQITSLTFTRMISLTFSRSSTDIVVNGQTLSPGAATTINGQTISKLSDGSGIIIGSSTVLLRDGSATTFGVAVATERLPVSRMGSALIVGGSILLPGSTVVYDGQTLSLDAKGSTAFVNGTPIPVSSGHADAQLMSALFRGPAGALMNNGIQNSAASQPNTVDAQVTASIGVGPSGKGTTTGATGRPLFSNEASMDHLNVVASAVFVAFVATVLML